jgi:endonuclease/exonuclease/phosphatase family metal-dependent hydrolase
MLHRALVVVWTCASLAGAAAPERGQTASPCAPFPVVELPASTHASGSAPSSAKDTLVIGSLNIAADPRIARDVENWARERRFDVLFLQEVGGEKIDGADVVKRLTGQLGLHAVYAPANLMGDTEMQGLAILSRVPIADVQVMPLEYHKLRFRSRCRIALAATVATSHGPVRVTNVHLDTRINGQTRLAQLAPVFAATAQWQGPQIIGGDFNTVNIHWRDTMWPFPYTDDQANAVRTAMADRGFSTPLGEGRPTLKLLGLPIRLDWIYLKELEATESSVDDVPITDHRGVWARVKTKTAPGTLPDKSRQTLGTPAR